MTVNPDEILVVVDENNQVIGKEIRKVVHQKGLWHRASDAWILNSKKMLLCQQRSFKKDKNPGLWEARFGGHFGPKDDYLSSVIKEVKEEIGVEALKEEFKEIGLFKSIAQREYQMQYLLKRDLDISSFEPEEAEVEKLEWMHIESVWNNLVKNPNKNWIQEPFFEEILMFLIQQGETL